MASTPTRSHWLACVAWMALAPSGLWLEAAQPAQPVPAVTQAPAPAPPVAVNASDETRDAGRTQMRLRQLLDRHPPGLRSVLQLDPSLIGDATYLAPYPELRSFLAAHPEVARDPAFFLGTPDSVEQERDPRALALRAWERVFEMASIMAVFLTLTGALVWLVRTLVDYRRWLRLSRVQAEAHAKLLDRLTQNDELLAYVQSPAGSAFLASAPISLEAGPRAASAPFARILWSVQAGVVLAFAGLGLLWASTRVVAEMGPPLSVLGILAIMVGVGFVASAFVAHLLARRLGLTDAAPRPSFAGARPAGPVA